MEQLDEKKDNNNFLKKKSLIKLKSNFEYKFLLKKKSNKGRTLIGLTDLAENFFENDEYHVWTFVIGSGEKYSSEKRLEKFYDNDANDGDFIYIMKKEGNLFFRINNDEYKKAYELNNDIDYYLYLENTNAKYGSNIRIIYIIALEEEKILKELKLN